MAIRVVVVGLGPRGQEWLREIQNAPGFEFVAGVDVDPLVLKQASGNGVLPSQCFADLSAALD